VGFSQRREHLFSGIQSINEEMGSRKRLLLTRILKGVDDSGLSLLHGQGDENFPSVPSLDQIHFKEGLGDIEENRIHFPLDFDDRRRD
jgi:hypothetical protein